MLETALLMLHYAPHARSPAASPRRRLVYDFPTATLVQYMHLRQDEAAKALGVAPVTLKRICQRRRIRWPHRPYKPRAKAHAANDDDAPSPSTGLPSYCVYTRPPPTELSEEEMSPARTPLPRLDEALERPALSSRPTLFPAPERPHLQEVVVEERSSRKAPVLPRIAAMDRTKNQLKQLSIAPSQARTTVAQVSPTTVCYALLPTSLSLFV